MEQIILVIHILTAAAIIGLILLQQGKGAEMGASFGAGASQTVFGSQGAGNFFSRATAVLATIFFVTSFGLAIVAKQNASISDDIGIPSVEVSDEIPEQPMDQSIPFDDVPQIETDVPMSTETPINNDIPGEIPEN